MLDDEVLDFNFWPSFADLMLSLVLVLILLVAIVAGVLAFGNENLDKIKKNQENLISTVAAAYNTKPVTTEDKKLSKISTTDSDNYDIEIYNEPTLQRITFSDKILFRPDEYDLNSQGEEVMSIVGGALKRQLGDIREIQIQGHADTDATARYPSNFHLAALRAIEVFKFLQEKQEIDPAVHLMSATSFGEFKPVERSEDEDFNREELQNQNASIEQKAKNRRIEILLFYKL